MSLPIPHPQLDSLLPAFFSKFTQTQGFQEVQRRIAKGEQVILLHRLEGSLCAFLLVWLHQQTGRPVLAVAADEGQALRLRDDIESLVKEKKIHYFPVPRSTTSASSQPASLRIECLDNLLEDNSPLVVTTPEALALPTIPPELLQLSTEELKVGQTRDLFNLVEELIERGFERLPMVEEPGQVSVRGGILDIFPLASEKPYRIEFFGNTIESIRQFDVHTQRSVEELQRIGILPYQEIILSKELAESYLKKIEQAEKQSGIPLKRLKRNVAQRIFSPEMEQYLPLFYDQSALLDYFDSNALVFLSDRADLEAAYEELENRYVRQFREEGRRGRFALPPDRLTEMLERLEEELTAFQRLESIPFRSQAADAVGFQTTMSRQFQGDVKLLAKELSELRRQKYRIYLLCENQGTAQRLQELLEPYGSPVNIGVGSLHQGFIFPQAKMALFNDHEIFSRYRRRYHRHKFKGGVSIPDLKVLGKGDIVVHQDHGIGKYEGICTITTGGKQRDCLQLCYRNGDKLYVPVEDLHRVKKYSGQEGVAPVLSKLGGDAWEKVKARAKRGILRMAKELLQLCAERKAKPGVAFSPDTDWQRQLESSFPYEETSDQLRAMDEMKRDLGKPAAMDRLVCGDVGYGKTEVAVRAAFKVVNDGKQVAILVPTTILAQQHYSTFTERLAPFPVRVEVLSRFRTKKQQREIVQMLKISMVDIVIGTHRLLSADVNFKDLGLVIIDEEHRFGVRHKEKLKQLRRLVDVLTLTATPIPRTLHMSLTGARDISVINTPPKHRLSIQTEILAFDKDQIAEAILREVDRGGQIYFVHNRVQSIDSLALFLERLLPQVRFAVGHGQMPPRYLERIMLDFLNRKYDCLVSTMIIEAGLDIPNVNTMIVNRADRFGLAQLYQLRGRVGRSDRQAYAYLLIPPYASLSPQARRRLRAIEEFTELGSGLKLALRDMEIRGAGNILGSEQHGFLYAVGFDMYCRLLEETIRELKGEKVEKPIEPKVEIRANAFIPDTYILESVQKVAVYQRLAEAHKTLDVLDISEELRDRYGPLPPETVSLLGIVQIKILAKELQAASVSVDDHCLSVVFPAERKFSRKDIHSLVEKLSGKIEFSFDKTLALRVRLQGQSEQQRLSFAHQSLQKML